jgi:inosine-uridine nucleoside N-ribohydrolase
MQWKRRAITVHYRDDRRLKRSCTSCAKTITILAIGPTTNLELAHRRSPLMFSRVKQVFVLGGVIDVPGNITQAPR